MPRFVTRNFNHGIHEMAAVPITIAFAVAATAVVVVAAVVAAVIATAAAAAAIYFAASHPRASGQGG